MIVGITGGIGAGKSYVSNMLRCMGYPVYDCDNAAKHIMTGDAEVCRSLIEVVGADAYTSCGTVNKQAIAAFLFADEANAKKISAIVHPAVREDFLRWTEDKDLCFMESAILFESGFDTLVDKCVLVTAPIEMRIQRTMQRDGHSEQDVLRRINAQLGEDTLRLKSDFIIDNDGTKDLSVQIEDLLRTLQD